MGFFKYMFGDSRVLTAKDPTVQRELNYMYKKYEAFIEEFPASRRETVYFVRCSSRRLFDVLYRNGLLLDGHIQIPGDPIGYNTKSEAFDGLMWLRGYLDDFEARRDIDARLF